MAPREHVRRWLATGLQWAWGKATFLGAIQAGQPAARRFGAFGEGSFIAFPVPPASGPRAAVPYDAPAGLRGDSRDSAGAERVWAAAPRPTAGRTTA